MSGAYDLVQAAPVQQKLSGALVDTSKGHLFDQHQKIGDANAESGKDEKEVVIGKKTWVIDVRTEGEFKTGHRQNAINLPYTEIKDKIAAHVKDRDDAIIVYCRSGRRSGIAKKYLDELGYTNVTNAGAYDTLKKKEDN